MCGYFFALRCRYRRATCYVLRVEVPVSVAASAAGSASAGVDFHTLPPKGVGGGRWGAGGVIVLFLLLGLRFLVSFVAFRFSLLASRFSLGLLASRCFRAVIHAHSLENRARWRMKERKRFRGWWESGR